MDGWMKERLTLLGAQQNEEQVPDARVDGGMADSRRGQQHADRLQEAPGEKDPASKRCVSTNDRAIHTRAKITQSKRRSKVPRYAKATEQMRGPQLLVARQVYGFWDVSHGELGQSEKALKLQSPHPNFATLILADNTSLSSR